MVSNKNVERQAALATAVDLASTLHGLRELSREVEGLLSDAIKHAHATGITQAIIAEGVGLSRGRINQIIKDGSPLLSSMQLRRRTRNILDFPDDALSAHRKGFSGHMTYPPYEHRRTTTD